jgi:hypothetical protein
VGFGRLRAERDGKAATSRRTPKADTDGRARRREVVFAAIYTHGMRKPGLGVRSPLDAWNGCQKIISELSEILALITTQL